MVPGWLLPVIVTGNYCFVNKQGSISSLSSTRSDQVECICAWHRHTENCPTGNMSLFILRERRHFQGGPCPFGPNHSWHAGQIIKQILLNSHSWEPSYIHHQVLASTWTQTHMRTYKTWKYMHTDTSCALLMQHLLSACCVCHIPETWRLAPMPVCAVIN